MKKYLIAALIVVGSLAGCANVSAPERPQGGSSQPFVIPMENFYTCSYKYDSRLNVKFYESDRAVFHPQNFPTLTVYHITDSVGKKWSINEFEWKDYTCVISKTAKRNKKV